jgi:hypothetical protein
VVVEAGLAAPVSPVTSFAEAAATPELDLDLLLDANITFHGVLIGDDGARTGRSRHCSAGPHCARSSARCSRWRRRPKRTGYSKPGTPARRSSST